MNAGCDIWAVVPVKDTACAKQRLAGFLSATRAAAIGPRDARGRVASHCGRAGTDGHGRRHGRPRRRRHRLAPGRARVERRRARRPHRRGHGGGPPLGRPGLRHADDPGDVPLVSPADIRHLLDIHRSKPGFTIVPARDERGSNAIVCSPADLVPLRFGADSFFPHLAAARACGVEPTTVHLPRIALDIDEPADLAEFMKVPSTTRARDLLERLELAAAESGTPMSGFEALLRRARDGDKPSPDEAMTLAGCDDLAAMMAVAAEIRDRGHGEVISYSRKVFIPLTKLCRDSCHYCTFAHPPRRGERSYLTPEEVIAIAQAGAAAGCREALFTLGDKPELRYRAARDELAALGHQTTISYLAAMSALVLQQTGLLPHLNPGVMSAREIADLRQVSVSQGLMLETAADRLSQRGGPHFGSPDKRPAVRLEMIKAAGEAAVPFTSGILIGIGETRGERLQALLHLRDLHERHGHLQEIIIQNFRAKPGTRMAEPRRARPRRSSLDHCRRPHPVRGGHEHPGAAQSLSGGAAASHCGGHQRLGRRLAGHAGPCESGAALAGARSSRARNRQVRQGAGRASRHLPGLCPAAGSLARTEAAQRRPARVRCGRIRARRSLEPRHAGDAFSRAPSAYGPQSARTIARSRRRRSRAQRR